MRKRHSVLLIAAFFLLSSQVWGQTSPIPQIFVSTFDDNQIVSVKVNGVPVNNTFHDGSKVTPKELPEAITVAPAGTVLKIYICDSMNNRIFRMNLLDGTQFETVYAKGNGPGPTGPQGCIVSNQDLFFNTRAPNHTGIWRITGVSAVPFGGTFMPPTRLPFSIGSTAGEGLAFTLLGDLLIVDRSGMRVLRSSQPDFLSATSFITGLPMPVGIAVDSNDRIYVSILTNLGVGEIRRFNPDGTPSSVFATFEKPDRPFFMAFDALDRLFVATSFGEPAIGQGAGGKVWQVNVMGSKTLLSTLSNARGIALDPNTSPVKKIQATFSPGPTISALTGTFPCNAAQKAAVEFQAVNTAFTLTVTCNLRPAAEVNAQIEIPDRPGAQCLRVAGSDYCLVYDVVSTPPFVPGVTASGIEFAISFKFQGSIIGDGISLGSLGMAHAPANSLTFTEDILQRIVVPFDPGTDSPSILQVLPCDPLCGVGEPLGFSRITIVTYTPQ